VTAGPPGANSYEYEAEEACGKTWDDPFDDDFFEECPFVGEVEIHVDDYGRHHWTCPECLTEHVWP